MANMRQLKRKSANRKANISREKRSLMHTLSSVFTSLDVEKASQKWKRWERKGKKWNDDGKIYGEGETSFHSLLLWVKKCKKLPKWGWSGRKRVSPSLQHFCLLVFAFFYYSGRVTTLVHKCQWAKQGKDGLLIKSNTDKIGFSWAYGTSIYCALVSHSVYERRVDNPTPSHIYLVFFSC